MQKNKKKLIKMFTRPINFVFIVFIYCFLCTSQVFAAINFSEVAWMGGQNSSADEWIELYNDSAPDVNLDNYVIESESKKISIKLVGQIKAGNYYLIERTDDDSVPGVSANLVASFGTGLNNSGDIIYLKDANGQIIDTLNFASGWPAGDNTTKQTMQKSGSSWLTGNATPGFENVKSQTTNDSNENQSTNNDTTQTSGTSGSSTVLQKFKPILNFNLVSDSLNNTPLDFELSHTDEYGRLVIYGIYKINFGDGLEEVYKPNDKITHIYEYPGQYRVTVRYLDSVWSTKAKLQTFINIQINEPQISIDKSQAPILIVKNESKKDIDLNNFVFSSISKTFQPPEGSIVFAGESLYLSPKITGFSLNDFTSLNTYSKSGVVFNSMAETVLVKATPNIKLNTTPVKQTPIVASVRPVQNQSEIDLDQNDLSNLASVGSSDFVQKQKPNKSFVWFLFGLLIVFGSFIFIKLRRTESTEAEKFTLLEE